MIRKYDRIKKYRVYQYENLSEDSLDILYMEIVRTFSTVLYAKLSRFYLSLIQTAASRRCQREQWFIFRVLLSPYIRGCWVYLLRSQIGDTIFSNFICSPDSELSESDDTRREHCREPGRTRPFPALFFCSVFLRVSLEYPTRDPLRNCNTALCVGISFNDCK